MAKTVVFLFHDDNNSLGTGSHVAERIRQVADDQGVELEVFCFGPAQAALTQPSDDPTWLEYREQIYALAAAGVRVGTCVDTATEMGTVETLTARGLTLEFARDAFVRFGLEGASVVSF